MGEVWVKTSGSGGKTWGSGGEKLGVVGLKTWVPWGSIDR